MEAEGYTTCRHYDCYGAGPAVTRRLVAEGYAPEVSSVAGLPHVLDAFKEMSRLHLLIVALNEEQGESAGQLQARLKAVGERFSETGTFEMDRPTRRLLRQEEAIVRRVLARIASGSALSPAK